MQEQFSYSLMASLLGILIVFSILLLLCGLMILIRKIAEPDSKSNLNVQVQAKSTVAQKVASLPKIPLPVLVAAATAGNAAGSIEWMGAAVAAYLSLEEDQAKEPNTRAWSSDKYSKYDPWVANNKLSKTVPGV